MKRVLFLVVVTAWALAAHADEKKRKPPRRAETPFSVFVDASPKGETEVVENILKAREELEKTGSHLKRGKGSAKDAAGDLAKRLERYVKENYWELEERRKTLAGLR